MKLGILDQAPLSKGMEPRQALERALKLAQAGERFGYSRFWMAEHHHLGGLACSAPEIMLAYIGAQTKAIRLGAGAILLPYYRPYKVAETFNMLAALFPGRVDLGVARSPGGAAEASTALSDRYLEQVWKLPEAFEELLHFLFRDFPEDHPHAALDADPLPPAPPEPWVLGTSEKSALLAARMGVAYAYGHFMNEENAFRALDAYRSQFRPVRQLKEPYALLAVSAVCADTEAKAREVAASPYIWRLRSADGTAGEGLPSTEEARREAEARNIDLDARVGKTMIVGSPDDVRQRLESLHAAYRPDELMILSYAYEFEDRLRSYELIAREMRAGAD
ncbi:MULTISPECIES: LLM class flavin-dependent oxidoreductase [Cohnella]|uniref:LLM class flavin-dependent oxidoreductase n=1 Tax=Cohnella TaxID=329857 RepID=UPI0009BAC9CD|nr:MULTISPECIES: LLM class flavin-dependent oxidoreductase [Cohnella]MBN2984559.1 LLM class flavin-dependent oxidoreductase [Cohnella algarum]